MVVIVTNWRLDIVLGRTHGICSVEAPEEFKDHSFRRGFPLTDPTHTRCAVFAVVLAMEQVLCSGELSSGQFYTAIVTKSKAAADMLLGSRVEAVRKWASDPRLKPLRMSGFSKKFVRDTFDMLDALRAKNLADVVYVEESEEDKKVRNLLTEHTIHLDIDPEEDYGAQGKGDQEDVKASDAKHRNLLRQELLVLGARSSRSAKLLTKKQRQKIAQKEGHAQHPEEKEEEEKAVAAAKKKKEEHNGKEEKPVPPEETPDVEPAAKPNPHGGLAAAIAAEELRAAAAHAPAASGSGGCAAPGDGVGDVQEPEHGACGGSGEAPQGVGEREAAASNTPKHLA
jgi:hypothetical protein